MALSADQKKFYENTLTVTKREITELESEIQEELAKVKDRLAELQNAQKAARQMYDAACQRLGEGRGAAEGLAAAFSESRPRQARAARRRTPAHRNAADS